MAKPKAKTKKKARKKKAKKTEAKGYDEFGRRLGTQGHLIDTKLSKVPKSVEQLMAQTRLPKHRIMTHVRDLCNKKYIHKNKDGKYSRKKNI